MATPAVSLCVSASVSKPWGEACLEPTEVTRASATTPAGRAPSSADCVIDNTPAAAAEVLAEMGTGAGFNLRMQGEDPSVPAI